MWGVFGVRVGYVFGLGIGSVHTGFAVHLWYEKKTVGLCVGYRYYDSICMEEPWGMQELWM